MARPTTRAPAEVLGAWRERAHALLLLFPAATLLWPGARGPLAHDLYPELTGAAFAALAALPAAAMLLARRCAPRFGWSLAFAGFVAVGLALTLAGSPTDTLEASRAALIGATALVMLLGGASLGRDGRTWLACGLLALTLGALAPLAWDLSFERTTQLAGVLGNTGSTAQVALLGAAVAVGLAARARGVLRWIGAVAAAPFALYVGAAPVLAAALALACVGVLAFVRAGKQRWSFAASAFGVVALFAIGYVVASLGTGGHPSQASAGASDTRGVAVRASI